MFCLYFQLSLNYHCKKNKNSLHEKKYVKKLQKKSQLYEFRRVILTTIVSLNSYITSLPFISS